MIIDDFRKKLRFIRYLILIVFLIGISVFYLYVRDKEKDREAFAEHKESANVLKNIVALIDYRIKEGKGDSHQELNKLFDVDGLTFVDAFAAGIKSESSCRKIDKIVMRYKSSDGKNRFVRVKLFDETVILNCFDKIYYHGEAGDSILGNESVAKVDVFSDDDDAEYHNKFERRANRYKNKSGYKKESDCCYLVKIGSTSALEVDEDGNKIVDYYVTADDLKDVNDYLDYEKTRYSELKDYIAKKANQTKKYENSFSTKIKRFLIHNKNMNNEIVRNYKIVEDVDAEVASYKEFRVVEEGHDENSEYSILAFLYLQMALFAVIWGLLTKFIPMLLGYKKSSFLEGLIFGGIPFFVATFTEFNFHTWLSYAFLLGSLPMIEGVMVALRIKSEDRYIKKVQS